MINDKQSLDHLPRWRSCPRCICWRPRCGPGLSSSGEVSRTTKRPGHSDPPGSARVKCSQSWWRKKNKVSFNRKKRNFFWLPFFMAYRFVIISSIYLMLFARVFGLVFFEFCFVEGRSLLHV